ncbi:hypothetical protein [Pyrinomonas sp.]
MPSRFFGKAWLEVNDRQLTGYLRGRFFGRTRTEGERLARFLVPALGM